MPPQPINYDVIDAQHDRSIPCNCIVGRMSGRTGPLRHFGGNSERRQCHAENNEPSKKFPCRVDAHGAVHDDKQHLGNNIAQRETIDAEAPHESIFFFPKPQGHGIDCE